MALVELLVSDATCRVATSRNLVVYAWRNAPTLAQIREAGRISRAAARKHPAGTALLDLILEGVPRFSEEVRTETARITADPTIAPLGVADVILLTGLAGVAVRSFIGTVSLLGRAPRPRKVTGDVASGAAWLAPRLGAGGEAWTPADVTAVAEEIIRWR